MLRIIGWEWLRGRGLYSIFLESLVGIGSLVGTPWSSRFFLWWYCYFRFVRICCFMYFDLFEQRLAFRVYSWIFSSSSHFSNDPRSLKFGRVLPLKCVSTWNQISALINPNESRAYPSYKFIHVYLIGSREFRTDDWRTSFCARIFHTSSMCNWLLIICWTKYR